MWAFAYIRAVIWLLTIPCIVGFHGFPPPTFRSEWMTMTTTDKATSFKEVEHMLGEVPRLVKVLVKATDGDNKGFIFEAAPTLQIDDDLGNPRGGVVFTFTDSKVYVWVFTKGNEDVPTSSILMGGQWGSGKHPQSSSESEVQVLAWSASDFFDVSYESSVFPMTVRAYKEIQHGLGVAPELTLVVGNCQYKGINHHFYGIGSQQEDTTELGPSSESGGILFAYNNQSIRMWASTSKSLITVGDGAGHDQFIITKITEVIVRVYMWMLLQPLRPSYDSGWIDSQPSIPFSEFSYPLCTSDRHVDVQVLAVDGNNKGYHFHGIGMAQGLGGHQSAVGGVVFAYNDNTIRIWRLNDEDPKKLGLIVVRNWGGGENSQVSSDGKIRVRVWCGNTTWTPADRGVSDCISFSPSADCTTNAPGLIRTDEAVSSPNQCAIECKKERICKGFVQDGGCHLFSKVQFGEVTQSDGKNAEYCSDNTGCLACT